MSEKHFLTKYETHQWVHGISSLDQDQRAAVEEAIAEFAGDGGVSKDELDYKLLRHLRDMRQHGTIGDADYEALERALKELYGES